MHQTGSVGAGRVEETLQEAPGAAEGVGYPPHSVLVACVEQAVQHEGEVEPQVDPCGIMAL